MKVPYRIETRVVVLIQCCDSDKAGYYDIPYMYYCINVGYTLISFVISTE